MALNDQGGIAGLAPYKGIRQKMETAGQGIGTYAPGDIKSIYGEILPFYEEVLGNQSAKEDLQAKIFFDLAQAGLNLASNVDPRTGQQMSGSLVSRIAGAGSQLPATVSERLAAYKQAGEAPKMAALSAAQEELISRRNLINEQNRTLLEGAIRGAQAVDEQTFQRQENEDARTHQSRLSELDRGLRLDIANLQGQQSLEGIAARGKLEEKLAELQQQFRVTNAEADFERTLARDGVLNSYQLGELNAGDELQRGRMMLQQRIDQQAAEIRQQFEAKYKDVDADLRQQTIDNDKSYKDAMLSIERQKQTLAENAPEFYTVNEEVQLDLGEGRGLRTFKPGDPIALTAKQFQQDGVASVLRPYQAPPSKMAGQMYMGLNTSMEPTLMYAAQQGDELINLNTGKKLPRGELNKWIKVSPDNAYDQFGKFRLESEAKLLGQSLSDPKILEQAVQGFTQNEPIGGFVSQKDEADYRVFQDKMGKIKKEFEAAGVYDRTGGMPLEEAIKKLDTFTQVYGRGGNIISKLFGGGTFGGNVADANATLSLFTTIMKANLASTPRLNQKELDQIEARFVSPAVIFGDSEQNARAKFAALYNESYNLYYRNNSILEDTSGYSPSEISRARTGRALSLEVMKKLKPFGTFKAFTPEEQEQIDAIIKKYQ